MVKKEEVFWTALHPDDVEMIRSDLGALGDIICCREFSILDVSTLRIVFSNLSQSAMKNALPKKGFGFPAEALPVTLLTLLG